MAKKPRWTPGEDAVLREFYMSAPRGRRYSSVHKKLPGRTKDAIAGRARYTGLVSDEKTRVITAFLEAAAEQGWHMRPDEATEEMRKQVHPKPQEHLPWPANQYERNKLMYLLMLSKAPKFEWDK